MKRDLSVFRDWLAVMLWSAIIALESTFGSAANTGGLLRELIVSLFGQVDPARFDLIHHILRKGGHFLGYGVLGYLWFRALFHTLKSAAPITSATLAVICASLIAALDEWHQSFMPDRTGQFQDVALDAMGAVALVSLAAIFAGGRRINARPAK